MIDTTALQATGQDTLETLAAQINDEHRQAEAKLNTGLQHARHAGELLLQAKSLCQHGAWLPWLEANFDGSDRTARAYMRVAQQWPRVEAKWQRAANLSIRDAMRLIAPPETPVPHITRNSGEYEWYTPPKYVEAARKVLGAIDLDPASCEAAQEIVKAKIHYTAENDGLAQPWHGKVFLNPPYSGSLIAKFADKLATHVETGDVTEAVVVVNNATDTGWFHRLARVSSAVCFPRGRIKFVSPEGELATPLQGQAIFYFGRGVETFRAHFSALGWTVAVDAQEAAHFVDDALHAEPPARGQNQRHEEHDDGKADNRL
jgi:ParB family chromosome partitioning protein